MQTEKRDKQVHHAVRCVLWILILVAIGVLVYQKLRPLTATETLAPGYFQTLTPPLQPGDALTFRFQATQPHLRSTAIAVSYEEDVSDTAWCQIRIWQEDQLLVDQPLQLKIMPQATFLTLNADRSNVKNSWITIEVVNLSQAEGDVFSLLATDWEESYPEGTETYAINGTLGEGRILYQATYQEGYEWYPAVSWGVALLLAGLLVDQWLRSSVLPRLTARK